MDAALRTLAEKTFDVVVASVRLTDERGLDFVEEVGRRYPDTLRFVLSGGLIRSDDFLRVALVAHQVLPMPCAPHQLEEAIERAELLRELVDVSRVRALVNRVKALPVVPETYAALQVLLADPDCNLDQVSALVSREVATSARLLQLVNSAVFARRQPARTVHDAVSALGLTTLRPLVLSMSVFEANPHCDRRRSKAVSRLLAASRSTAEIAAQIAPSSVRATAHAAAMLHDIGRLVMLDIDGYADLVDDIAPESLVAEERRRYGACHPEVGAYLLTLWGVPGDIVRAVALHHAALEEVDEPLAGLVAVATRLAQGTRDASATLEREHLEPLGLWNGVQSYLNAPHVQESA